MRQRCEWPGIDPAMIRYHDEEWGTPVYEDRIHFEFLLLESAQAGLSWKTIFNKRANYRKAFARFNAAKVAKFTAADERALLKNPGIVRNRLKIKAAIHNAKCFLEIQKEFGSFSNYIWRFVSGKPKVNRWKSLKQLPAFTPESDALSADLKKRGFKFVGSTVMYAHMQATGLVNDHRTGCFRHPAKKGKPAV